MKIKARIGAALTAMTLAVGVGVVGFAVPAQAATVYTVGVSGGGMGCELKRLAKVEQLKKAGARILNPGVCINYGGQNWAATISYYA